MANGGNPLALSQQSFLTSIHQHVVPGWIHTHFLSFSKSNSVARRFAIGSSGKSLHPSTQNKWDTLIVEIDLSSLVHIQNLSVGMDHYQYNELGLNQNLIQLGLMSQIARHLIFQGRSPGVRNVMLIDVHKHLLHLQKNGANVSSRALNWSKTDQEVLILPVDPLPGVVGNTALLNLGCVSQIEYFALI
jgi:hypothetical protein